VPQVASSPAKVHAHSHAQAHAARASQTPTPAASAPFASLLDDDTSAPAPQPKQKASADTASSNAASTSDHQPAKADTAPDSAQDQSTDQTKNPAKGQPQAADDDAAAAAAQLNDAIVAQAATTAGQTDGKNATGKDTDKTDAAGDQTDAAGADPSALADALATAVAPPPTPVASPINATRDATQTEPTAPAFVAAAVAQKLEAFDGKAKAEAAKPADAAATTPVGGGDQPATPPVAQDAPAPDPKALAADKNAVPKPEAPAHHARVDAAATGNAGGTGTPGGTNTTDGGAQANLASVAGGTAAAHSSAAATTTTATSAQAAPAMPQAAAVPMSGLAVEIAGRAQAGKNNFEIRLDPPELGRIQVKLSVDRQGQVTSHLIADRADTLDLLRRDASGLERALQDAGLKTAGDGLQFSLRDQSFAGQQNGGGQHNTSQIVAQDDALPALDLAASGYTRYSGRIGGVDIRV
jgi:flagellar hook-length control protein FliK